MGADCGHTRGMDAGLASSGEGTHREKRGMVLFRLQKGHVGVGCEMYRGGQGASSGPGGGVRLGPGLWMLKGISVGIVHMPWGRS